MTKRSLRNSLVAACAAVACLALPAAAGAASFSPGFQEITTQRGDQIDARDQAVTAAGGKFIRIMISWRTIAGNCTGSEDLGNPDEPCYNWYLLDPIVQHATNNHLGVLASFWMYPKWATGSDDWKYTAPDFASFQVLADHFADFAKAVALRYGPASAHGTIGMYTIGNEPGSNDFWLPDTTDRVQRFAYQYKQAATKMRAANPSALLAPGPTGPKSLPLRPLDFIDQFQTAMEGYGATGLVDAWAHNPYAGGNISPYTSYLTPPSVGIGNMNDLYAKLDESSITAGVPVWGTEFAYQTNPPDPAGTTPAKQAAWAAQALDVAESSGRMPILSWYVLFDPQESDDWDSGFYYKDGTPKPGLEMFRRPIAMTSTSRLVNGKVRVYGRSNVGTNPRLVYRIGGSSAWRTIPGQTGLGSGGLYAYVTPDPALEVAVQDDQGTGPVLSQGDNRNFTDQVGGNGADKITGGNGADVINGGKGNDILNGGNGNDLIDGGLGNDSVIGGGGNDTLLGGAGNDKVSGGAGNDKLDGGKGNDKLDGGAGNDKLTSGVGNDQVRGGTGNDTLITTEDALSKKTKKSKLVKVCKKVSVHGKKKRRCGKHVKLKYRDKVFCGSGKDTARVDWNDVVAHDCEKVKIVN
jgi:hypothetical protein